MTPNELNRIFQKGECLSLDTMKLYTEGKLPKKSAHLVEEHLLECGLCAGAIDGLNSKRIAEVTKLSSHIQRRLSVYMNTPPRVPFFRRYGFSIIAGLILLSGGTTVWYFATRNSTQEQHIADSTKAALLKQTSMDLKDPETNAPLASDNTRSASNTSYSNTTQPNQTGSNVSLSNNLQNLPATQPGKTNTLSVDQSSTTSATTSSTSTTTGSSNDASTTRTASTVAPLKIKSVIAYPPVTHDNGKGGSSGGGGGQLAMSTQSSANFKLDEMPAYPGGDEALKNYIMTSFKSVNLDKSLITRYTNGAIITINSKTGEVTDVQLSYSLNKAVDDELIRVLKAMPLWNPGKKRGSVDVMIGVTFE